MSDLTLQVIAGVVVAIIVSFIGIGQRIKISHNSASPKTGKKIMIVSAVAILIGAYYGGQSGWDMESTQGVIGATTVGCGVILFFIGRVISWYQKN